MDKLHAVLQDSSSLTDRESQVAVSVLSLPDDAAVRAYRLRIPAVRVVRRVS